jgi:hypothetical protein
MSTKYELELNARCWAAASLCAGLAGGSAAAISLAFVCRSTSTDILVNMGGVVVDDDNNAAGLRRFCRRPTPPPFLQNFTQSGNLLIAKIMRTRSLEKLPLAADAEQEFIISTGLDLTQMLDEFDGLAPTQVMG